MGYRSEVVFAVDSELAPFFTAMLANSPDAERLCRDADQYESGYEEEGDFFMYWNHIKWYESYPEIKAIEEFIAELDEGAEEFFPGVDDVHSRWRFVRIGEDYDDVEDKGGGFWDTVNIQRAINF